MAWVTLSGIENQTRKGVWDSWAWFGIKGFRPAFADLLAEQVLWQARAASRRQVPGLMKPWRGVCLGQWRREGKTGSGQGRFIWISSRGEKELGQKRRNFSQNLKWNQVFPSCEGPLKNKDYGLRATNSISTLRFAARPSDVLLGIRGAASPIPTTFKRLGFIPLPTR